MADKMTLIMVPGFMCNERLFAAQIAGLQNRYDIHVIIPSANAVTMGEMAQEVLARAPKHFAILGLSMGGIVAMEVVKRAPDRVTHLALFDCSPFSDTPESTAVRYKQIDMVRTGKLHEVMLDTHIPAYFGRTKHVDGLAALCLEMADAIGAVAFINHQRALIGRVDQSRDLVKFKVPTLIACGDEDQLCPPKNHSYMHRLIAGSKLEFLVGAGHMPTYETPKLCNSIIDQWLEPTISRPGSAGGGIVS